MTTAAEQLILKALSDYCKGDRRTFRNRHMSDMTGLSKQLINHHLRKWTAQGFVSKNPLVRGEWILLDLPGLIAEIIEPNEPTKMGHAKHELFDKELINALHQHTELYAALKALNAAPIALKESLEKYLTDAINQLRNERTFMHTKQYAPRVARQMVRKYADEAEKFGVDIESVAPVERDFSLIQGGEEQATETQEDKDRERHVWEANNNLNIYLNMTSNPTHGSVQQALDTLKKYGEDTSEWEKKREELMQ